MPWGTAPKCWLIKEDSEDRIVHSTQQNVTIPNNEFLGNITPLIPFDAEVTKRIQTGVGRSRDIMLLYLNLCIAECIEKPAFIQKGDPGNLEKELIADPEIDGKSLKEYVKVLLKKYFQQNANRLNKEKIFPELIDPQNNM